jgi:serine/threonine protein kinase
MLARNHIDEPLTCRAQFVRKELRPWSTKIDYELELRNLSVLKLLKHSCIIELLACFTYRDKFNFIFSLANGGTLADLLSGKRPSPYEKPEDFLIALCGLSSAVRAVHTFLVDDFEAIGCHHDLKPSNVLLHGSKLLLADFGLSRFKDLGEGSASYFRGGRGDFIAPECEDLGEDFKKHIVHRSSDVWSFGCIISEVLTFLQGGVEGVRTFRSSRMFEIENIKYFRFHSGSNIPNPQVWSWLAQLGRKDDRRHVHFLIHVIGLSLELQPERRSNITVVDKWLRFIAIDFLADETERLFEGICYRNKLIPALVEKQRFKSWRCIMEALATSAQPQEDSFLSANNYNDFEAMVLAVKELYQTLQSTILESSKPQWRLFLPLRKINDTLYHTLPSDNSRASARMHFECHLLESQDSTQLQELSEAMSGQSGSDTHIGHLAAVKRLKLLVENSIADQGERTCQIDHDAIDRTRFIQDFYIGRLNQKEKRPPSPNVLVEAKNYDDHYSIDSVARELFGRLEAIVRLLNTAGSLRVLHCQGYYHHPGTYSLGLVYNYPELQYPDQQQPQQVPDVSTLHEILKQDIAGRHRPLLGDRFRLAHSLASSLFEFHKVNWVQKAISAFNIVFFRPPMALSWKDHMSEPYFMGFLASRQDEEACFTEGPTDDSQHRQYLCPEYLRDRQRFLQHYDYYSLGLVLLELGLWRTLGDIRRGEAFQGSPEKFRDALLRIAVPRLGQTMGAVYQSAVEECLRWGLQESEQSGGRCSSLVCLRFRESVVGNLAWCRA